MFYPSIQTAKRYSFLCATTLFLLFTILNPLASRAATLLGSLSDISGRLPPISASGTFYSPTRYIQLHSELAEDIWGPYQQGYDYSVGTCEGHEFHIVPSCKINGTEIPYIQHFYTLNIFGECIEVYSWKDVIIDLEHPGEFTLEITVDNSLHVGKVASYDWFVYTCEPISTKSITWGAIRSLYR